MRSKTWTRRSLYCQGWLIYTNDKGFRGEDFVDAIRILIQATETTIWLQCNAGPQYSNCFTSPFQILLCYCIYFWQYSISLFSTSFLVSFSWLFMLQRKWWIWSTSSFVFALKDPKKFGGKQENSVTRTLDWGATVSRRRGIKWYFYPDNLTIWQTVQWLARHSSAFFLQSNFNFHECW